MYYLQSRYYDPKAGRFINADGLVSTGQGLLGNNMFAYCGNNPVNRIDPSGQCFYILGLEEINPLSNSRQHNLGTGGGSLAAKVVGASVAAAGFVIAARTAPTSRSSTKSVAVPITGSSQQIYTVYFLYDMDGDSSVIVYVGRVKTSNFDSRMAYHRGQGRLPAFYISDLDYAACRAVEQGGMIYHHTINRNNLLNNQIRGISPTNSNRYTYLSSVFDLVNRSLYPDNAFLPISYWENFTENEFLNLGS